MPQLKRDENFRVLIGSLLDGIVLQTSGSLRLREVTEQCQGVPPFLASAGNTFRRHVYMSGISVLSPSNFVLQTHLYIFTGFMGTNDSCCRELTPLLRLVTGGSPALVPRDLKGTRCYR